MENAQVRVVDGSNGLLLEVDGQIVPNYDATFRPIEEGEVVTGHVVRIDKDEVLVDIGYKSEGVIAANELSIRKSVDPKDEVHLGEERSKSGVAEAEVSALAESLLPEVPVSRAAVEAYAKAKTHAPDGCEGQMIEIVSKPKTK